MAISASGKDGFISRGEARFKRQKDRIRKRLLKYTRKAFRMLPAMAQPRILDIGCGNEVPTLELARLSDGEITGLDRDQSLLDKVARKAEKAGVADSVKIVKLIRDSGIGYVHEPRVLEALRNDQREIEMFKRNPGRFSSVFFVMSN